VPVGGDARLITLRQGGTLNDEHHRLLAERAAVGRTHSALFDGEQPRDTRSRYAVNVCGGGVGGEVASVRHDVGFAANAAAGLAEPAKFLARAAGRAAAVAHVAAHDLGAAAYGISRRQLCVRR